MKIELKKIEDSPQILEKITEGIEELIITKNEQPISPEILLSIFTLKLKLFGNYN